MSVLPEVSDLPALSVDYFPTPWQAALFRCWGLADENRLARALGASTEQLRAAAGELGLNAARRADPLWSSRGYLTLIRGTWHLLSFEQTLTLLNLTDAQLAALLKEDDFLWHKLGQFKPRTPDCRYRPLTEAERARTREIAAEMATLPECFRRDPAFAFVGDLTREEKSGGAAENAGTESSSSDSPLRTIYSYFALYGDPLSTPELDPFPDGLLQRYARMGVKGVWLQGVLYQLVEFPFAPELSAGWEKRLRTLNDLIRRAKRFGIGVYLYLNEPRSMPEWFFKRHPHLRGTREGDFWAMCTSRPEVKRYLHDAARELFTRCPELAGFFTITMSENLTNCFSRGPMTCPRCAARRPEEAVAEVNNLLARGAREGNPAARAVAWSWGWGDDWAEKVAPLLTEGQIVQCTSEEGLKTSIGGVSGSVLDYTLSQCGPGEKARRVWRSALGSGHECCAKVQLNNSWELAAVPWLPVFDRVAEHMRALRAAGVRHLQCSWTLGGYPSPNLMLAGRVLDGRGGVREFLNEWLGPELAGAADAAQRRLSAAFSEFPFHVETVYTAPMNFGPMLPFYLKPTGRKATMIGFPYDDLDSWRSIYPRPVFRAQFERLVAGWREGTDMLAAHEGEHPGWDEMLTMARAALVHFSSALHQIRFVEARDAGDREAMLGVVADERANVRAAAELRARDSRIGYEASNHYFYSMNDLCEKMLNLSWAEQRLRQPMDK